MGVILDTSEFIFAERHNVTFDELLAVYASEECGVSVVTLAEIQHGVRRARSSAQRNHRESYLLQILDRVTIYPITPDVALLTGSLDAELEMRGETLPLADLMIAATALTARCKLGTRNVKHFQRIDGLRVISPVLNVR